jgi:glutamyl/glutaminyl-tRNA synthetase
VGILPEALFNFLALLGWSPGENRELMSKEEMIASFDLERVKQSPGQFALKRKSDPSPDFTDEQRVKWLLEALPGSKLEWMNGEYLRKLPIGELFERVKPFIAKRGYDLSAHKPEYVLEALKLEQERARNLSALAESVKLFFQAPAALDPKAAEKVLKKDGGAAHLKNMRTLLADAADFSAHALEEGLKKFSEQHGLKFGDVSQPIRVALSGTTVSPPIHLTLALLGKEESLRRIDAALAQVA